MAVPVLATMCVALLAAQLVTLLRRRPGGLGTAVERATFDTLHTAGQAAKGLRGGLTAAGGERAIKHLRPLLGAAALALTDHEGTLAVDGHGHTHPVDPYVYGGAALAAACPIWTSRRPGRCGP